MTKLQLGVALVLAGCAEQPPAAMPPTQVPLDSSYAPSDSGYSSSDYTGAKGLGVPHRAVPTDTTVLTVRPDAYRVAFAVREVSPTPAAALDAAKALSERVAAELTKALGPAASVRMRGLTLSRLVREDKPLGFSASVDGELRVALGPAQDFWARSRLYTAVIAATQSIAESAHSAEQSMRTVSFEPPEAVVDDPESHRAELVKRWVTRTRDFATAAQSEGAPLAIRDCEPPGPISQTPVSFDEVHLQLDVLCHIDTPGAPRFQPELCPAEGQ
jgi:hypothetical protein